MEADWISSSETGALVNSTAILPRMCITGMSGLVGSILEKHLKQRFRLLAINRRNNLPGVPTIRADISSSAGLAEAMRGVRVVIHLAASSFPPNAGSTLINTNVTGTYNILEASVEAGVKQFIFASSLSTIAGHYPALRPEIEARGSWPKEELRALVSNLSPRPDSVYGASKIWGETLCRLYHDQHRMGCVAIRLGGLFRNNLPDPNASDGWIKWCSHADLFASIDQALDITEDGGFAILNAITGGGPTDLIGPR